MVLGRSQVNQNGRKTHCKRGHAFDEANTLVLLNGGRVCRACHRERQIRRYKTLPDVKAATKARSAKWLKEHPERKLYFQRRWREENKRWVEEFRASSSCKSCGESHPACLDFHHRDSSEKEFNISDVVTRWSLKRIREEIEKCDVLCSNCHRKYHYNERSLLSNTVRN